MRGSQQSYQSQFLCLQFTFSILEKWRILNFLIHKILEISSAWNLFCLGREWVGGQGVLYYVTEFNSEYSCLFQALP